MEDPLISLSFIATAALACLIFVLSLSEAALLGANPQLLRRKADDGHHGAELAYQVVSSGDYLSSIIVGINLSVIVIATLATAVVHRAGAAAAPRRELFHLSIIAVLLALAELTPKTYGSLYANELAPTLAPFVAALTRVFALPVAVLTGLAESVLRLLRVPSLHERRLVTEEDIIAATDLGEESGAVEAETGRMLDAAIELRELTARDVMVPRIDIVAVPVTASLEEVLEKAENSGFTRLPVYEGSIDNIVGVVHVNNLISCLLNGGDWRDFISGPLIVTEATSLSEVFRAMRQARSHMAVVADEFGGTAGIVTMEDILEELVGEIRDEHDRGQAEITELAPGELLVDGSARLADVYERLGVEEPDVDVDTVAGLLFELTGRIPSAGETVDHEGIRFVVEESDGQHVEQVRVVAVRRKQGGER